MAFVFYQFIKEITQYQKWSFIKKTGDQLFKNFKLVYKIDARTHLYLNIDTTLLKINFISSFIL